jgi:hypothetical protein
MAPLFWEPWYLYSTEIQQKLELPQKKGSFALHDRYITLPFDPKRSRMILYNVVLE